MLGTLGTKFREILRQSRGASVLETTILCLAVMVAVPAISKVGDSTNTATRSAALGVADFDMSRSMRIAPGDPNAPNGDGGSICPPGFLGFNGSEDCGGGSDSTTPGVNSEIIPPDDVPTPEPTEAPEPPAIDPLLEDGQINPYF